MFLGPFILFIFKRRARKRERGRMGRVIIYHIANLRGSFGISTLIMQNCDNGDRVFISKLYRYHSEQFPRDVSRDHEYRSNLPSHLRQRAISNRASTGPPQSTPTLLRSLSLSPLFPPSEISVCLHTRIPQLVLSRKNLGSARYSAETNIPPPAAWFFPTKL